MQFLDRGTVVATSRKLPTNIRPAPNLRYALPSIPFRFASVEALSPFRGPVKRLEAPGTGDGRRAGPILSFAPQSSPVRRRRRERAPGKARSVMASQQSGCGGVGARGAGRCGRCCGPAVPRSMTPPRLDGRGLRTVAPASLLHRSGGPERIDEMMGLLRRVVFPGYFDPAPVPTTRRISSSVSHLCG